MSRRRILITGATGGLGQSLVAEAARRGHDVLATGRSPADGERIAARGGTFQRIDLTSPDADLAALTQGCDSVIHAAALSASWGNPADFERTNVSLTRRLLGAAEKAGVRRFIFVSSPSIFADFRDRIGLAEHDAPADPPLNAYAKTKLQAEREVLAMAGPMACCAIRPRALVGPGDRVMLPRLAQLARRKRMPLPGGGMALVELTDLRDAAWAICEAEERAPDLRGRAINLSGGKPAAVRTIALQLAGALNTRPRLLAVPMPVAHAMASLAERWARLRRSALEPVLTRYTLATLGYSQTFDPEPARRLLGYAPQHDALATLLEQARALRGAAQ
ncbi:MAG: NAD-dependent epimerase/dehydratase family protein [Sphingomonadales bacterium]|nr:NAD-dependent epimerase/dehydratase family protein [Sphingomonadales bacterium]